MFCGVIYIKVVVGPFVVHVEFVSLKIYFDEYTFFRRITEDEYDKYQCDFRNKVLEIDSKLALLEDAEENYYLSAKTLLNLANRAHELFVSSEVEEKRLLVNLVLQNLQLNEEKVQYNAVEPFNTFLICNDRSNWLPLIGTFITGDFVIIEPIPAFIDA